MPRSRSSGGRPSAPSRPSAPAARPAAPQQQQTRPMSTAPAQQRAAPPAQASQGPGLFGQMASTAAGVAVGSSIGHAIGGFFGGGSSAPAQDATYQQSAADNYSQPGEAMDSSLYNTANTSNAAASGPCAQDVFKFRTCMDENKGDMNICGWYLDQLKACQAAARPY